jgi:hypothetical protein
VIIWTDHSPLSGSLAGWPSPEEEMDKADCIDEWLGGQAEFDMRILSDEPLTSYGLSALHAVTPASRIERERQSFMCRQDTQWSFFIATIPL